MDRELQREKYLEDLTDYNNQIKILNEKKKELQDSYLVSAAPCKVGDVVEITRANTGKVTGVAKSFGILEDDRVYVTALQIGSKVIYISKPYQSIRVIEI